jgi:hypothetical protein
MPNKKNLDKAKRERALKLLDETDPGLAKRFREELKKRSQRKDDLRPADLLQLHPSFWSIRRGFYRWQLLSRKQEYRDAEVFKSRDSAIFTGSFYSRFYENYPPKRNERFSRWSVRTIQRAGSTKSLSGREREVVLSPDFFPDTLRLPDRWPPVPPEIEFPHPHVLDRLTSSSIGVAVVTGPFPDMSKIQINGRVFWVDLNFSLDEICKDIFGYFGLEGLARAEVRERRRLSRLVKTQLGDSLRHRKRNEDPARLARALHAWDMKQDGATYRKIAETQKQVSREKKLTRAAIDRAKKDVRYIKHLIKVSFSR